MRRARPTSRISRAPQSVCYDNVYPALAHPGVRLRPPCCGRRRGAAQSPNTSNDAAATRRRPAARGGRALPPRTTAAAPRDRRPPSPGSAGQVPSRRTAVASRRAPACSAGPLPPRPPSASTASSYCRCRAPPISIGADPSPAPPGTNTTRPHGFPPPMGPLRRGADVDGALGPLPSRRCSALSLARSLPARAFGITESPHSVTEARCSTRMSVALCARRRPASIRCLTCKSTLPHREGYHVSAARFGVLIWRSYVAT